MKLREVVMMVNVDAVLVVTVPTALTVLVAQTVLYNV